MSRTFSEQMFWVFSSCYTSGYNVIICSPYYPEECSFYLVSSEVLWNSWTLPQAYADSIEMSIYWVTFIGLNMLTNNPNFNHSVSVSESVQDSARKQASGLILRLQIRLRRVVNENSKNCKGSSTFSFPSSAVSWHPICLERVMAPT